MIWPQQLGELGIAEQTFAQAKNRPGAVERGTCQLRSLRGNIGALIRGPGDGRSPRPRLAETGHSPAHN